MGGFEVEAGESKLRFLSRLVETNPQDKLGFYAFFFTRKSVKFQARTIPTKSYITAKEITFNNAQQSSN